MSTEVPSVDESNATTAAQPTNKTVQTERATPVAVDGATAIFMPAYTRTDDGNALEQVRDELTHLVGIYSEPDVRKQLGDEYDPYEITRAIERGERMTREHEENVLAAIRVAEKNEAREVDRGGGAVADGGTAELETTHGAGGAGRPERRPADEDKVWVLRCHSEHTPIGREEYESYADAKAVYDGYLGTAAQKEARISYEASAATDEGIATDGGVTAIPEERRLDTFESLIFGDKLRYVGDHGSVLALDYELTFRSISMYGETLTLGTSTNGLLYLDPEDYPPSDFVEVSGE